MRAFVCLLFLGYAVSLPILAEQDGLSHLSGIVISESGTSIEGVNIYAWHKATTDAEGKFDIPNQPSKDSVVYFQKERFRPTALVVKSQTNTVKVVLEDDKKTAWFIPACLAKVAKTSPKGEQLEFLLPKNAKLRGSADIDYRMYVVSLANSSKPLQLWYGPLVNGPRLVTDLTLRSASFEERSIHSRSGEMIGYDQRGKTEDGLVWRSADFPGLSAIAIYEGVSEEVSIAFDQIIDSACQLEHSH
jgi:hypothetical protein